MICISVRWPGLHLCCSSSTLCVCVWAHFSFSVCASALAVVCALTLHRLFFHVCLVGLKTLCVSVCVHVHVSSCFFLCVHVRVCVWCVLMHLGWGQFHCVPPRFPTFHWQDVIPSVEVVHRNGTPPSVINVWVSHLVLSMHLADARYFSATLEHTN